MKNLAYSMIAVMLLAFTACSETDEEASGILPSNDRILLEDQKVLSGEETISKEKLIAELRSSSEPIIASNGETTMTIAPEMINQSTITGPFTAIATLNRLDGNPSNELNLRYQRIFLPSGGNLAAGYYFCDIWESRATVTVPAGGFAFNVTAATTGYTSPYVNAIDMSV